MRKSRQGRRRQKKTALAFNEFYLSRGRGIKWFHLTIELVTGLILLFAVVTIAGKKLISQMSPFTFISALVLGELLGNALYDDHIHLWYISSFGERCCFSLSMRAKRGWIGCADVSAR
ncbi:hypothetical protein MKY25_09775 [Geobacillus sp. FSL W8-0032]|uniref:hypothetical protein n=1 Tax=Geobacillus TaxID=129337 RepID=UPI0030DC117C